jgi:uncharacterized membrane-anchored protein YhcB (DUF1043 family)
MLVSYDSFDKTFHLELKREMSYKTTLGADPLGNITRINNALDGMTKALEGNQSQLEGLQSQLETAKSELGTPFPHEAELTTKLTRLTELNVLLNIESKSEPPLELAADKPPRSNSSQRPTAPDKGDTIAESPPKGIYAKMNFYKKQENQPPKNDGIKPKSKDENQL